jgi:hypothetical protein
MSQATLFQSLKMSVEENTSKKISRPRKQTSWVWQYFKEEIREIVTVEEGGEGEVGEESEGSKKETYLVMKCQVRETPESPICGVEYNRKDSSTGNAISHLRLKHDIIQEGKVSIIKRKGYSFTSLMIT